MTILRGGLIQLGLKASTDESPEAIRRAMIDAHIPLVKQAGESGVQVLSFQEVFTQPYFCPSQDTREQPAAAVANGCWIGAINRVGREQPWNIGEFYGQSYFVNPRGQIEKQASHDRDELIIHDMNMDMVKEVRDLWQFFRDRRPSAYGLLVGRYVAEHLPGRNIALQNSRRTLSVIRRGGW